MADSKKSTSDKKDAIILPLIVIGVIVAGVVGLYFLQKYSVNNKYICSYLGGLWMRKDTDAAHRCYTYEEFYR
ncbi:hypothetical protein A2715_04185 [Candidatus Woesebacteria bacterium RIFCSPHIGHO2_01_FULL_39_32]|uniref:Uncharacterized protein n=2 Tax=Candidatus Woeseibacteriota TaxID=1752722 RepID=A0A0G0SWZ6_9BACT|nr:MAG: hypothetical protein UT61_C0013G0011 [Candidatus Woesebacteria bacterium GW2011_GWA1_39_8]OGM04024.1 MAG: hypothetical protein A2124_02050 [Candidatus Woesebacteria bacterium GWB1_37_5]OGM25217.1 MAG: hypothetical protein A2715_04185 [Candidatus Woesebacteria bacterium RIFCSPHIGHO2_01_FULL_39_32]OGM37717.1 MAG: hypothetical protein A3F01_01390 [Candidatus Woesebacteria bacterium RIFCSPHIGHO2_12_FULL_38_11]OGM64749.1 MAG: hypothetical protein A2893_03795 [Candidatus Woesebacteria bacteri